MELSLVTVFIAGLLTFIAPCTLPLIPAFIGYLAGNTNNQKKTLLVTAGFTIGFSLVFILFGLAAGFIGTSIIAYRSSLTIIGGLIIILMGLYLILEPHLNFSLFKGNGFNIPKKTVGFMGSVAIGASFGFGWSPCLGPILGAVLTIAATSGNLAFSTMLLAIYSIGLSIPFFGLALFYNKLSSTIANISPRSISITRYLGGMLFVLIGFLILFNSYNLITNFGTELLDNWYFDKLSNYL